MAPYAVPIVGGWGSLHASARRLRHDADGTIGSAGSPYSGSLTPRGVIRLHAGPGTIIAWYPLAMAAINGAYCR
jgi:hypothetical protein